jgi:hypothetical protein
MTLTNPHGKELHFLDLSSRVSVAEGLAHYCRNKLCIVDVFNNLSTFITQDPMISLLITQ